MKEWVTFQISIYENLKSKGLNEDESYLLLSVDGENVYWHIKIDKWLNEEFINLLKLIIPAGVFICGVLYLKNKNFSYEAIKNEQMNEEINNCYLELLKCQLDNERKLVGELFYSFIIDKGHLCSQHTEYLNTVKCLGKSYKFRNSDKRLAFFEHVNNIKFDNLLSKFKSEYFVITSFINPLVVINKQSLLINELYSNCCGLRLTDLNLIIPYLSDEKSLEKIKSRFERALTNYSSNLLNCSILVNTHIEDDLYFEETNNTFYSINQDKKDEQIIKSIKINLSIVLERKEALDASYFVKRVLDYYNFIFAELYSLNCKKTFTYSLYEFYKEEICPFPLGVLYSSDDNYDKYETTTLGQRTYFHKILNLPDNQPLIRKFQLEQKINENLFTINETEKSSNERICAPYKNIHMLFNLNNRIQNDDPIQMIQGDYLYYYTNMNPKEKMYGSGYRALQTLISYSNLNGYSNIDTPSIEDLRHSLKYLGIKNFKADDRNLTLSEISSVFTYHVDTFLEITVCKNLKDFENNLSKLVYNFKQFKTPIIIKTDRIYTVLGVDLSLKYSDFNQILLLNHSYSGSTNIISMKKSSLCHWIDLENLISNPDDSIEILTIKFSNCI